MSMQGMIDITPTPRILRMVGEIPFAPWQCIAELVDNSLDSFLRDLNEGRLSGGDKPRVVISWSSENVSEEERQLEVTDTGPGMTIEAIQNSVKAGYTTKDPVSSLGLFGMGFNIATARLGTKTIFMSATRSSENWIGVEIDLDTLGKSGEFHVPTLVVPKTNPGEHGTRVIVKGLKPPMYGNLKNSASQIREILGDIYAPFLTDLDVEIMVQSKRVSPRIPCLWDSERYVVHNKEKVPTFTRIDHVVGSAWFDADQNRYLTADEEDEVRLHGHGERHLIHREKRIHGWLGIQRYLHPSDFGIDFIRKGRKILRKDKTLFAFLNPLSGAQDLDYPTELASTVGGRIIGEIHIDHVPLNYQKSDFDRTDASWFEVVETLRGAGPVLPKRRKAMGYNEDASGPLARLIRGYQVNDQGTKHLAAVHPDGREYAKKFREGHPDYQSDQKWWESAQEFDRQQADKHPDNAPAVDSGKKSSDNTGRYGENKMPDTLVVDGGASANDITAQKSSETPGVDDTATTVIQASYETPGASRQPSPLAELELLKQTSRRVDSDSGPYTYRRENNSREDVSPFQVNVWETTFGNKIGSGNEEVPCKVFKDGNQCDFFYNPRHPFLHDYPVTYRDLLLISLAERFKTRDNLSVELPVIFAKLVETNFGDTRLDLPIIQQAATNFLSRILERVPELLRVREQEALDCVHEAVGEVEEILRQLMHNTDLMSKFQHRMPGAIGALSFAPSRTLMRLITTFPEEFFDGKLFNVPYMSIELPDVNSKMRLREDSKDRLMSFLKDVVWIVSESALRRGEIAKTELSRSTSSLEFLKRVMVS